MYMCIRVDDRVDVDTDVGVDVDVDVVYIYVCMWAVCRRLQVHDIMLS